MRGLARGSELRRRRCAGGKDKILTYKTKLLLPFDSDYADTAARHTMDTVDGTVGVSTSVKKFGAGSLSLNGTAHLREGTPANKADFTILNSAWTWDAWIAFNDGDAGYQMRFYIYLDASHFLWLGVQGHTAVNFGRIRVLYDNGAGQVVKTYVSASVFSDNTFRHVRVCYDGNTLYPFLDGVLLDAGGEAIEFSDLSGYAYIQVDNPASGIAYVDDMRWVAGACLSTANFDVPTQAFGIGDAG